MPTTLQGPAASQVAQAPACRGCASPAALARHLRTPAENVRPPFCCCYPCFIPPCQRASRARFPWAAAASPGQAQPREQDQPGAGHEGFGQEWADLQVTEQCTKHQGQATFVKRMKRSRKTREPVGWHRLTPSLAQQRDPVVAQPLPRRLSLARPAGQMGQGSPPQLSRYSGAAKGTGAGFAGCLPAPGSGGDDAPLP